MLTSSEKVLYHQIHPAKLSTDIASSLLSTYLFWVHQPILGILGGFIPSIIASAVIIRYVNLDNYRTSPAGRYLAKYMTRRIEALRMAGQIVVWFGAWYHAAWIIVSGYLIVVLGWMRGKIAP